MVIVSRSPPDYAAASQSLGVNPGPVVTQTFASLPLFDKVIFHYGIDMNIFNGGLGQWRHEHG
jgi:hypothetical protein